jgi:hypothetical protein
MFEASSRLPDDLHIQLCAAIQQVRTRIRWKPGKAQVHLGKRIRLGHLPPETRLAEYEAIIKVVVDHTRAAVYVFHFGSMFYPTVVAPHQGRIWLVMFGMDGVMETAFPPDDPVTYFQNSKYHLLGSIQEFLS